MKKICMIIMTLLICLASTSCKREEGGDIQLDGNPSNSERDSFENIDKDEAMYDSMDLDKGEATDIDTDRHEEDIDNDDYNTKEAAYLEHYYVAASGVRMREDATIESDILDQLSKGTRVEYIDRDGDWFKVKHNDEIGYIRNDLLSETEPIGDAAEEAVNLSDNSIESIVNPKIIVKKADRILQLWDGNALKASYSIGLGWNPLGVKQEEGDGKTPEGSYYVCTRNNVSRFYLSLGLSYPNKEDASEALEAGLIDQGTYKQIEDAINSGAQPPWNTTLGGEIMIHGHGSQSDWTAGCIAVDNDVMDILWDICSIGTRVIIEP